MDKLSPGRILARKYEVVASVGQNRDGASELYMLHERATGIDRTARFFFPDRNDDAEVAAHYAQKLHKLRHCDILMQYRTQETISVAGESVTFLVSDHVEGQFLREHLAGRPFKRLSAFEGLHLLHALAAGVEQVHRAGDFHGELHPDNIVVRRYGLGFKVKLVAVAPSPARELSAARIRERMRGDLDDLIAIFHEAIGGAVFEAKFPATVKALLARAGRGGDPELRDASDLRAYLEGMPWDRRDARDRAR